MRRNYCVLFVHKCSLTKCIRVRRFIMFFKRANFREKKYLKLFFNVYILQSKFKTHSQIIQFSKHLKLAQIIRNPTLMLVNKWHRVLRECISNIEIVLRRKRGFLKSSQKEIDHPWNYFLWDQNTLATSVKRSGFCNVVKKSELDGSSNRKYDTLWFLVYSW